MLRAGYSMGYNRPGMSDFTGAIDDNPGISLTANRSHALNNLGTPGSILLRNRGDLGPPPNFPLVRNYPLTDVITGDVTIFEPGLQVPYAMTWTAGWQRKIAQRHGGRGALRRHAVPAVVAESTTTTRSTSSRTTS